MLSHASVSAVVLLFVAMLSSLVPSVSVSGHPVPVYPGSPVTAASANDITLRQLETAFAGNCQNTTMGEVISCADALPYINAAMNKYNLQTRGQRAAYIATMAYEGGYLKYDHNLVTHSQGTRSILPALSLRQFVDTNKDVQMYWPHYPSGVDNDTIVDILIKNHLDFEPGAWWTVSGPGWCAQYSKLLSGTMKSFVEWEQGCINGGNSTIAARWAIYTTVFASVW